MSVMVSTIVNGDKVADFQIEINGVRNLVVADFIL